MNKRLTLLPLSSFVSLIENRKIRAFSPHTVQLEYLFRVLSGLIFRFVAGKINVLAFEFIMTTLYFHFMVEYMVACTISLDYGLYISLFYIDFKNQTQTY